MEHKSNSSRNNFSNDFFSSLDNFQSKIGNEPKSKVQTVPNNYGSNDLAKREPKESSINNGNKPAKIMGYKFLESLLGRDNSFVLTTLASRTSGFEELLNTRPLRPDLLILITRVLNKVNHFDKGQLKMHILSAAFKSEFFDEIKRFYLMSFIEENSEKFKSMEMFFQDILSLFESVTNNFPSLVNEKLKSALIALNLLMKHTRDVQNSSVMDCLFDQWKSVFDHINSYLEDKNQVEKQYKQNRVNFLKAPNNFRDLPLVPTKDDFLCNKAFLRHNVTKGSFQDVENYLDIHFRLLREDFIAPLRTGIYEYVNSLNSPQMKRKYTNVKIYQKVCFQQIIKIRNAVGYLVNFDCDKKVPRRTNWVHNKRFMFGSLLLFSDDAFQSFYLATVMDSDVYNLQNGLVCVAFVPGTEAPSSIFEPGKYFTMAESEVYYEAYRYVLAALKHMRESNFPMKQYIVDVETAVVPPQYLKNNKVYSLSGYKFDILMESSWPSHQQLKLNISQYQAFKAALTNEFVVIQGPPGTGKTFLALKIAEVLLNNAVSPDTPIIVVCYTNHALDQFLEGILNFTNKIIRIGSRSQNVTLYNYNYEAAKKHYYRTVGRRQNCSQLMETTLIERDDLQSRINGVEYSLNQLHSSSGILEFGVLRTVLVPHHYNELNGNLVNWLLCFNNSEVISQESPPALLAASEVQKEADIFNGASEFFEQDFEDVDDDENAQGLAVMTEDDFFQADFLIQLTNMHKISYSLTIEQLDEEIKTLIKRLEMVPEGTDEFDFLQGQINSKMVAKNFIPKRLSFLNNFKFDPVKFHTLTKKSSVWEMNGNERCIYYTTLVHLYCCQLKHLMQHLIDRYQNVLIKLNKVSQLEDLNFVKNAAVIGLTTSGAAKRRILLENLNTKIVIVEEAAQVLEAHVVTSLTKSVQHVILIGDHKQLRPNPAEFELAKKYGMDISLFERMLSNGLGCNMLDVQHRMRPEIASLVRPIYPTLMDHPSTLERPRVTGIDKFVFFLTHNNLEDEVPDSASRQNKYEGDFLIALCNHLMLQGYKPQDITILTTYTGQVSYMRKEKQYMSKANSAWARVLITSVDNFQGEESKIILLSLVRSNKEARIGFLSTENRVCVALSRAKEGLYIVGNMGNLTASSNIWPKVKQQLDQLNAVGRQLTLRCPRHPDQFAQVSNAKDFAAFPEGGCTKMCDTELPCGHVCPRKCHIIDQNHANYLCQEPCARLPCDIEGHKCPLRCYQTCNPCVILLARQLACGHFIDLPCHVKPASATCKVKVPITLPDCKHDVHKQCFQDVDDVKCSLPCILRMDCGHSCTRTCHVNDDPDHLEVKCMKDCVKNNETCPNNHTCKKRCYEECGNCVTLVNRSLSCGHRAEIVCSLDVDEYTCMKRCNRKLVCGHPCPLTCYLPCKDAYCRVQVDRECAFGHTLKNIECSNTTYSNECIQSCNRNLACGHPCTATCIYDCTKVVCKEEVVSSVAPACGHPAPNVPCHINTAGKSIHFIIGLSYRLLVTSYCKRARRSVTRSLPAVTNAMVPVVPASRVASMSLARNVESCSSAATSSVFLRIRKWS